MSNINPEYSRIQHINGPKMFHFELESWGHKAAWILKQGDIIVVGPTTMNESNWCPIPRNYQLCMV